MTFVTRDPTTGLRHGGIRWPHGTVPTPFGCRWCGTEKGHHGIGCLPRPGVQGWTRPTNAQILVRMLARRAARLTPSVRAEVPSELMVTITVDDRPFLDAMAAVHRACGTQAGEQHADQA